MKTNTQLRDAKALAESFDLKTRTLADGRVQVVHPKTAQWVEITSRADVQRITDED